MLRGTTPAAQRGDGKMEIPFFHVCAGNFLSLLFAATANKKEGQGPLLFPDYAKSGMDKYAAA
ncbi:hypothetical protein ASY01nite_01220 [Acetobacter syzygii]|nr:hypothetical protein Absy_014_050 [Acetobacter syzygii]GBR63628.1 hypothetical protein AA0483_0974 [Acetobacter syzygii NRIC 0483]GEL55056.1 hypothetical protein ASY01nite_01220 [Acetobacter syzygii]